MLHLLVDSASIIDNAKLSKTSNQKELFFYENCKLAA